MYAAKLAYLSLGLWFATGIGGCRRKPEAPPPSEQEASRAPGGVLAPAKAPESINPDYPVEPATDVPEELLALVREQPSSGWGDTFRQRCTSAEFCPGSFYEAIASEPSLARCAAVRIGTHRALLPLHCLEDVDATPHLLLPDYDAEHVSPESSFAEAEKWQIERVCFAGYGTGGGGGVNDWAIVEFSGPGAKDLVPAPRLGNSSSRSPVVFHFPRGVPARKGDARLCPPKPDAGRDPLSYVLMSSQQYSSGAPVYSKAGDARELLGINVGERGVAGDRCEVVNGCARPKICESNCTNANCGNNKLIPAHVLEQVLELAEGDCPQSVQYFQLTDDGLRRRDGKPPRAAMEAKICECPRGSLH